MTALIFYTHQFFFVYTLLLMIRIVGSWFPRFASHRLMYFLAVYTDPYLNLFRRLIPPSAMGIDFSPILAFFGLRIAEYVIIRIWIFLS